MDVSPRGSEPQKRRRRSRFGGAQQKEDESNGGNQKELVVTSEDGVAKVVEKVSAPLTTSSVNGKATNAIEDLRLGCIPFSSTRSRLRLKAATNTRTLPRDSVFGSAADDSDSESDDGVTVKSLHPRKRARRPPGSGDISTARNVAPTPIVKTEHDPLDDFMKNLSKQSNTESAKSRKQASALADDDGGPDGFDFEEDAEDDESKSYLGRTKKKRLVYEKIDHSKVTYHEFRKNLYIEVPELERMTQQEVNAIRRSLGNIRIRGKHCPKPIRSWGQCGLSHTLLEQIRKLGYIEPTPIQAQGIPCIMRGRDVIGIARTGSGKTLAFVLPVLRHVAIQSRAATGDGPTALVIAPTRELAIQIYHESKRFARLLDLRCVCAYGGSGVKDQITELKRGADIVICTPGRMIDLLAMNSGRITNLRRVTIVVLDEADRMFDMGFEPQLTRIVENVRLDRQTVMFSATFPKQVENLARRILRTPIEITVGGNSVVASTIEQHIEVRTEDSKFFRLLELLGTWYERGSTLVFVDRQESADRIFSDLRKAKYLCLPLHGGRDQADRDSAIADFRNGDVKILVATSVAARGLDVPDLRLVVNYDVPNHYEDYVHRVGRTGRAGRAGTAYTFVTKEQESHAPDLVKALTLSTKASITAATNRLPEEEKMKRIEDAVRVVVPSELKFLADNFERKRRNGIIVHGRNSGYGGKGFKFDNNDEYNATQSALRKAQAKRFGVETDDADEDDNDGNADSDDDVVVMEIGAKTGIAKPIVSGSAEANNSAESSQNAMIGGRLSTADIEKMKADAVDHARIRAIKMGLSQNDMFAEIAKAKADVLTIAAQRNRASQMGVQASGGHVANYGTSAMNARLGSGAGVGIMAANQVVTAMDVDKQKFAVELEINDYPQHARWQVTRKNALSDVEEFTSCVFTTRGNFYPAGRNPPAGQRKLHFLIEGPSVGAVKSARREIKRKLEEAAVARHSSEDQYSKYTVV